MFVALLYDIFVEVEVISLLKNEDYLTIFHEIKNSITLINGSLQLVEKKHPEVSHFEYWEEAMSEIDFLIHMVTQLSSARLCGHLNLMQVNIYSFMDQFSLTMQAFTKNNFSCIITLEENLPLIELDPQLIRQAIINLVKNAYEAMNHTGEVHITVSFRNPDLSIIILDHGGGLDPTIEASIFQPFITSKASGSGIGLSLTKQIVECHHGTLTYESRPGDGCTFTIRLPFTQS